MAKKLFVVSIIYFNYINLHILSATPYKCVKAIHIRVKVALYYIALLVSIPR
jgi:hypothetical protein